MVNVGVAPVRGLTIQTRGEKAGGVHTRFPIGRPHTTDHRLGMGIDLATGLASLTFQQVDSMNQCDITRGISNARHSCGWCRCR